MVQLLLNLTGLRLSYRLGRLAWLPIPEARHHQHQVHTNGPISLRGIQSLKKRARAPKQIQKEARAPKQIQKEARAPKGQREAKTPKDPRTKKQ